MTSTAERASSAPADEPGFEQLARAVDDAVTAAAALDGHARKVADALRESIEAAHKQALVTIVRTLRTDDRGRELLYDLVDDPLVHLLLSLHGIIRPDPLTQARTALESVRPGLQSHGGDVELVRIDGGVAYVRLSGACNGCSMSSVTMRNSVEQALVEQVAAITSVEVLPSEPSPTVIPLSSLRRRVETRDETGWVDAGAVVDVAEGVVNRRRLVPLQGQAVDAIVVRLDASLTAYLDECAHQALPLRDAEIDVSNGTLTCPWHGFCYDALSGECLNAPGAALEQLPLRVEGGRVWIRVGS